MKIWLKGTFVGILVGLLFPIIILLDLPFNNFMWLNNPSNLLSLLFGIDLGINIWEGYSLHNCMVHIIIFIFPILFYSILGMITALIINKIKEDLNKYIFYISCFISTFILGICLYEILLLIFKGIL